MAKKPDITNSSITKHDFESIFKEYFVSLCHFAQKYIADQDSAKEIVHQVFITIWEKKEKIDFAKSIKPYLFRSVHNRCLNYIRDRKKENTESIDIEIVKNETLWENPEFMEENELAVKINDALGKLPEKCREIFELNRFEGLKYMEVADKLNISVKTVEAQMSKALKILKAELIQYITIIIIGILILLQLL